MRRLLLTTISIALAVLVIGCTAAQLGQADRVLGGTVYSTSQPTTQQLAIDITQRAAQDAAGPASYIPVVGPILSTILTIIAGVVGVFAVKQTSALSTANNVIAAAAPGVAQLVHQTTDNQALASDITTLAGVAPGVIALMSHPTAQAAVNAAGLVPAASKIT